MESKTLKIQVFFNLMTDGSALDESSVLNVLSELDDHLSGRQEDRDLILGLATIAWICAADQSYQGVFVKTCDIGFTCRVRASTEFYNAGGFKNFRKELDTRVGTRRVFLKLFVSVNPSKRKPDNILTLLKLDDQDRMNRLRLGLDYIGIQLDLGSDEIYFRSI